MSTPRRPAPRSTGTPMIWIRRAEGPLAGVIAPGARLGRFPAAREQPRNHQEPGHDEQEGEDLRPQLDDGRVTPEHLDVAVQRPRVEGEEAHLLHALAHQEAWEHAAPQRGLDEHEDGRERPELRAG